MRLNRNQSGKVGKYIYAVVTHDGTSVHLGLARWEAAYMMRENNGKGRGWKVRRFTADDAKAVTPRAAPRAPCAQCAKWRVPSRSGS